MGTIGSGTITLDATSSTASGAALLVLETGGTPPGALLEVDVTSVWVVFNTVLEMSNRGGAIVLNSCSNRTQGRDTVSKLNAIYGENGPVKPADPPQEPLRGRMAILMDATKHQNA